MIDNSVLAKAVASKKLDTDLLHWNYRDTLAVILNSLTTLQAKVFHISRNVNGIAHSCANQVLRYPLGSPIYECTSSAHSKPLCHVLSRIQISNWQGFVIHSVTFVEPFTEFGASSSSPCSKKKKSKR
uniref:Uncharacterized protein n=1 Tax=Avena sativa TaxID=4498 RepID=A0ACD5YHZ6_AVESA